MTKPHPLPVPSNRLLTTAGFASYFGVSLRVVQIWCEAGKLKHFKTPGGHRRILSSEVERLKPKFPESMEAPTLPPYPIPDALPPLQSLVTTLSAYLADGSSDPVIRADLRISLSRARAFLDNLDHPLTDQRDSTP